MLAHAGPQVDDARPDLSRAGRARGANDGLELRGIVGEPRKDRRDSDADVDARRGEPTNRLESARGRRRARLGRPPDALVERRQREEDFGAGAPGRLLQHVDVTHDERPARHDRVRRPGGVELDEAGTRETELPLGGLVRIRRGAERHLVPIPRSARELAPKDGGDVRLDADRPPVAVVRGAVGTLLEVADVTERAAVHAAHVRVDRPPERHAAHLGQRRLARLDPVLDPHRSRIEHMFVRGKGGRSSSNAVPRVPAS